MCYRVRVCTLSGWYTSGYNVSNVTITLTEEATIGTKRRVKRHGYDYDLVWEHFIDGNSAPGLGILVKSHKTNRYTWFNRKTIMMPFYDGELIPDIINGVKTYTPNKQLVYEYLDHITNNVLSKRDQKRFSPIYENVKAGQLSLIDRIANS